MTNEENTVTDTTTAPAPINTAEEAAQKVRANQPVDVDEQTNAAVDLWKSGDELVEPVETLPDVSHWQKMTEMAAWLSRSKLVPEAIRGGRDPEADCVVILLAAHDLGLRATVAFNQINIIDGKMALSSELMRLLIARDGHDLRIDIEWSDQGNPICAVARGRRKDKPDEVLEARYSLQDALAAKLVQIINEDGTVVALTGSNQKPGAWQKFTEDMLAARVTSRWARRYAADSLGGVSYTPEELGDIANVDNEEQPYVPCPQSILDQLRARIDRLPDEGRQAVREGWKQARLGPLTATEKIPNVLAITDLATADALIGEVERITPAEAEVIHDEADPARPFETPAGPGTHVPVGDVPRGTVDVALPGLSNEELVTAMSEKRVMKELVDFQVAEIPTSPSEMRMMLVQCYDARVVCADCGKPQFMRRRNEDGCECPI